MTHIIRNGHQVLSKYPSIASVRTQNITESSSVSSAGIEMGDTLTRSQMFSKTGDSGASGSLSPNSNARGMLKSANYAGSAVAGSTSNVSYTSPSFYSPIHTAVNWQIPTKRREVYMWRNTENNRLMLDDMTFVSFKEYDYVPEKITEDTLTDGVVYEDIKCDQIYG